MKKNYMFADGFGFMLKPMYSSICGRTRKN